eukprot:Gb_04152 [translate_table: standard]
MVTEMESASTSPSRTGFSPGDVDQQSRKSENKSPSNAGPSLISPWSHVVRGQPPCEPSPVSNAHINLNSEEMNLTHKPEQCEQSCSLMIASDNNNNNAIPTSPTTQDASSPLSTSNDGPESTSGDSSKKPAWRKPTNDAQNSVEVGAVMGALCWPALADARNSKPSDLSKPSSEGSTTQQGLTTAPPFQNAPVNVSPSISLSPVLPNRQKFAGKRGGQANGTTPAFSSSGSPPPLQVHDKVLPVSGVVYPDPVIKGNKEIGMKGFKPGPGSNEQARHQVLHKGNAPHLRADSNSYSNNFGNRRNNMREQARVNYEWSSHRGFNSRGNINMQQRVGPRNFLRPPLPPFITPARGFPNPLGFHDAARPMYFVPAAPHESVRDVPYFAPAPPPGVFISGPDAHLRSMLIKQIDYYFSIENLCRDIFLRQNMDEQGWVSVSLIANFNRVRQLTTNVALIIDTLRNSTVVELQGDKVRKRGDWSNWLLPHGLYNSVSNTLPQHTLREEMNDNEIKWAGLGGMAEGKLTAEHKASETNMASSLHDDYGDVFPIHSDDGNQQICAPGEDVDGSRQGKNALQSGSFNSETAPNLHTTGRGSSDQDIIQSFIEVRINGMD